MNFSEYTLVSFGDSYTFGQGSTIDTLYSSIQESLKDPRESEVNSRWKHVCNKSSYTAQLEKSLGFKSSINLGTPAFSNKSILKSIYNYVNCCEDLSDKFFVIALTATDRDLILAKQLDSERHSYYDFSYSTWSNTETWAMTNHTQRDLKKKSVHDMYQYYFTDFTVLLNHIFFYNSLIDFLENRNIKYIIFDLLNNTPDRNVKYNILDNLTENTLFNNELEHYDEYSIFKKYYRDLEDEVNKNYLNYFSFKSHYDTYLNTDVKIKRNISNIDTYIGSYGEFVLKDFNKIISPIPNDNHWNKFGHSVATELLADWIRKNYE